MNKGGKRSGSGRKAIEGKNVKIKLPYDVINELDNQFNGVTLADKVRASIESSLNLSRKSKKLNVLDLFCGAGGLSLGFKLGGFNIYGGIDFDSEAMKTHEKNFNCVFDVTGDISKVTDEIIKSQLKDKIDVIIGGPPCQGFSSANRHEKDGEDPRNKLFYEYIRFVRIINPLAFVIENVSGILTKENGYAKNHILSITKELGYNVVVKVLNTVDYGVPETRRRAIFVGIKKELNREFDFSLMKKVVKPVTVYEAIGDLYYTDRLINNSFLDFARDTNGVIQNNEKTTHSKIVVDRIKHVPQGGNWEDVPKNMWSTERNNRHSSAYKRLDFSLPSITIDTGHMNYFHPIENRIPTVRESARLQSFPDSFIFMGNRGDQYKQVGNAVAPLFGKAIAEALFKTLSEEVKNGE